MASGICLIEHINSPASQAAVRNNTAVDISLECCGELNSWAGLYATFAATNVVVIVGRILRFQSHLISEREECILDPNRRSKAAKRGDHKSVLLCA